MSRKYEADETLSKIKTWCDRRERCLSEVNSKLRSWKVPESEIYGILKKLQDENYIDERRFAEAFTSGHVRLKSWGEQKVRNHLSAKGLSDQIISHAIADLGKEELDLALERNYNSAMKKTHSIHSYEDRMRLAKYLSSRGFNLEDIWNLIDSKKD